MSKYDKASLVHIPSGYKSGTLYNVLPNNGDGDFDFTRASTATRVDENGLIETVATGTPRLNYPLLNGVVQDNPTLLLEPQRQNVVSYSEKADEWGRNNSQSPTLDTSINNPYGQAGAYTTSGNGTSNFPQYALATISPTSSGTATASVFFKQFEAPYVYILIDGTNINNTGNTNSLYKFTFATEDLAKSTGADAVSTSVQDYGNGWYRIVLSYIYDGTANFLFRIRNYQGATEKAEIGTSKTYAWGAQLEEGSHPTSYIPTAGSAVTRSADAANGAGTADDFNDSEGVLYANIAALANDSTYRFISISDGSSSNRVFIGYRNTSNSFYVLAGTSSAFIPHNITNVTKIAVKYKSGDTSVFIDGFEVVSKTDTYTLSGLNELAFDSGTGSPFYGNTKEVIVFKEALSDIELEALTSYTSFTNMANELNLTIK